MVGFSLLTYDVLDNPRRLRDFTRRFLKDAGIRPSRRRGQNFTVSTRYLRSFEGVLREFSQLLGDKWALEVGTGLGVVSLTAVRALPEFRIVSVEADERLFEASSHLLGWVERLSLVRGDGLSLVSSSRIPLVFSSTPFNISTPLVIELARNNAVSHAVLGVQKEVADRLLARPGSGNYGRLTVITQLIFDVRRVSNHMPREFWPPPDVSASVVTLTRKKPYDPELHGRLEEFSACLFSQRNRLARRIVAICLERLFGVECPSAGRVIPEGARVRDLSPAQVEALVRWGYECR